MRWNVFNWCNCSSWSGWFVCFVRLRVNIRQEAKFCTINCVNISWPYWWKDQMGRVKRIWYLSPMRAAKVQASLRIRAVSPEPPLLAHTSSESRGTYRQKARSLAPLNGWACAVKICHDGMLEDTNSLDAPQITQPLIENINFFLNMNSVNQSK